MLRYELPVSIYDDMDGLESAIRRYRDGSLNPAKFKGIRVPFGIYEQRRDDTYMTRIRCASGVITPKQLQKIAALSSLYGASALHVTTRQAIQIHDVRLEDTIKIIRGLIEVGLSSRGGGGNTVRNIVSSISSGIDREEFFDVAPYAVALTSALIAEPDSWGLPRKYKIAFSNTEKDSAFAGFTDLGFIATTKEGKNGFSVYVAGGLGRKPQAGHLLYDFILPDRIYPVAEGLKHLFDKHGNRKERNSARLRFLWESLGAAEFRRLLEEEIAAVEKTGAKLKIATGCGDEIETPVIQARQIKGPEFDLWKARYVKEQKQKGFCTIKVPLYLGDIRNEDAIRLAEFLLYFGEDVLRLSMSQNIHIRNIPTDFIGNLYEIVAGLNTQSGSAEIIGDVVACTGANTCKLGITLSRDAAKAVVKKLEAGGIDLGGLAGVAIHISGCPNSCGRHLTADLGFFGKAFRNDGRLYPAYNVVAGSVVGPGKPKLGRQLGEISARDLPNLVKDILQIYIRQRSEHNSFAEFANAEGAELIKNACAAYSKIPAFAEDRNYYYDWGSEDIFSLAGRGVGECSAGMLDMIDYDAALIREGKTKLDASAGKTETSSILYQIALASARMLLVTRGVDAGTDREVFNAFAQHFISSGYIPAHFRELIDRVSNSGAANLSDQKDDVIKLSDTVLELYKDMDNSLNFNVAAKIKTESSVAEKTLQQANRFKDYRGVACPMNFVKIKIELSTMKSGESLEVWLDDGQPIENVPASVQAEGHQLLDKRKKDNYWSVVVRKA
jgi:sulfite reductase (ferredoxin)